MRSSLFLGSAFDMSMRRLGSDVNPSWGDLPEVFDLQPGLGGLFSASSWQNRSYPESLRLFQKWLSSFQPQAA